MFVEPGLFFCCCFFKPVRLSQILAINLLTTMLSQLREMMNDEVVITHNSESLKTFGGKIVQITYSFLHK